MNRNSDYTSRPTSSHSTPELCWLMPVGAFQAQELRRVWDGMRPEGNKIIPTVPPRDPVKEIVEASRRRMERFMASRYPASFRRWR